MANSPQWASWPSVGHGLAPATNDASLTAPTHTTTVVSATSITVASVTTVAGSQLVTVASGGFPAVIAGCTVFGTGIAPGSTVLAVSGNNLVLSLAATASGTVSLIFAFNGIKVEELDIVGVGTTVAGRVNVFMYDGTTYWLVDQFVLAAVTPSATIEVAYVTKMYDNLVVPPGSLLVFSVMEIGNESLFVVNAYGGAF